MHCYRSLQTSYFEKAIPCSQWNADSTLEMIVLKVNFSSTNQRQCKSVFQNLMIWSQKEFLILESRLCLREELSINVNAGSTT